MNTTAEVLNARQSHMEVNRTPAEISRQQTGHSHTSATQTERSNISATEISHDRINRQQTGRSKTSATEVECINIHRDSDTEPERPQATPVDIDVLLSPISIFIEDDVASVSRNVASFSPAQNANTAALLATVNTNDIFNESLMYTELACIHNESLMSTEFACIHNESLMSTELACIHNESLRSPEVACIHNESLMSTELGIFHSRRTSTVRLGTGIFHSRRTSKKSN